MLGLPEMSDLRLDEGAQPLELGDVGPTTGRGRVIRQCRAKTEGGQFVEVQGSGEESTFSEAELNTMLALARAGIGELVGMQRGVIG